MNKQAVFGHFAALMDDMLDNSLFFPCYFQNPTTLDDNIYGSCDDAAVPENVSIRFGVSRGCIIDENYDYVVKFDLDPEYMESCCKREVNIFKHAKEHYLDQYFTEIEYLGTYTRTIQFYDYHAVSRAFNWYGYDSDFDKDFMKEEDNYGDILPITISIPLYGCARADTVKRNQWAFSSDKNNDNYVKQVHSYSFSPLMERNEDVAVSFMRAYGEDVYARLSDFLEDEHVNDIHSGNVGMLNDKLVLIDYAGFYDSF